MVTTRAHGGVFGEPVPVPGPAAEPRVAVGQGGRAVIAVARTESCAESLGLLRAPGGGAPRCSRPAQHAVRSVVAATETSLLADRRADDG